MLPLVVGTRWYLRRAPAGYLWERATYATLAGTVGETVEGGRTIEALGLREEFVDRIDRGLPLLTASLDDGEGFDFDHVVGV